MFGDVRKVQGHLNRLSPMPNHGYQITPRGEPFSQAVTEDVAAAEKKGYHESFGSFPLTVTVTTMGYRSYKNPLNKAPLRAVTGRGNDPMNPV